MANNELGLKVGLNLQTEQGIKDFNSWSNKVQAQAQRKPIKIDIVLDGQKWEKSIQSFVAKNGDLVETTKYVNKVTKEEYEQITKVQNVFDRLSQTTSKQTSSIEGLNSAQQRLNNTTRKSVSVFGDFVNTFMKMVKFNTINMIYDGLITKMSEAIQTTNDFDAAMTEFKKVTDTSNLSLSEYTETLGQYGDAVARTQTQMLEAATEFSKAGFDPKTSAQLAQVASLFQNIADSEISAGDSASFIISQIKAFDIEANNATSILDKINEVSNNFSVSSTDITSALTKQSASLSAYGNSLDKSIALVTSGSEIMTGQAGKVARGLRTIGANIVQLAQASKEFEITVNGATKTIQLWNETGTDMLDTYDVLQQISAEWEHMTNAEKSSLAITLAKKTQMDTFLAVMSNFEDAEKAYTTALLSEGSAWKENAAYMESIEAHQAKLQQQWEKLLLSAPIEDLEKALLHCGTVLLKFANSDIGQAIIKVTAFGTIVGLLSSNIAKIPSAISSWIVAQYGLNASITAGTIATDLFTAAILKNPVFWGIAVVAGIVAVVKALDSLIVTYNEQIEKLNETKEAYESAQDEIKNLTKNLEDLAKLKKEINEKKLQLTDSSELNELKKQTNEIERQEASLNRQLVIAKAKAEAAKEEAEKAAKKTLTKQKSQQVSNSDYGVFGAYQGTPQEVFSKEINALKETQAQIIENNKALEKLKENEKDNADEIDKLTKNNEYLVAKYNELESAASETAEELNNVTDVLGDVNVEIQGQDVSLSSLLDKFSDFVGWNREATNSNNEFADSEEDVEDELDEANNSISEQEELWEEYTSTLSNIQDAYDTLKTAVKEYNENQGYSAKTLAKLNELSPQYLAALVNENGQLSVNVNLLQAEFEAEKQAAIEKLNMARYTAIAEACEKRLAEATQGATTEIQTGGTTALEQSSNYDTLASAAMRAAAGMSAVKNGGFDSAEFEQEIANINAIFDGLVHNVEDSSLQIADTGSKSAGSHKDAWVEAFKEEKDALDNLKETEQITEYEYYERLKDLNEKYFGEISGNHKKYLKEYRENEEEVYKGLKGVYNQVKDYLKEAVEHGYEKAINALKKEEKKVLAEIKKQIEAIKKEKEEVIKGIEKQIKALKKEKEAVEKYYNDQIDAIKRENEVLQQQNELLEKQQELQKAKQQKVMVMQQGRFQLTENESAVAQAEQNLSNYEDQLSYEQQIQQLEDLRDATVESIEERIEALEEYKEFMEEYYDEQIEAMEEYYDQVQEEYEKQIEALQEQLDAFKEGYQKEEDLENARLAAQVLGMNERKDLYEEELSNLKDYINEVNAMLALLGEPGAVVDYSYSPKTGYHSGISEVAGVDMSISSRASGDSNFAKDEMALVGESPNAELVLGSRLNRSVNSGELVHLSKGSGVVNAESTQTLAGLLNGLSTPTNVANNRSTQQNFTFGNISLPNVTDANSFVNTLSNKFNNYAIQYGNTRK